MAYTDSIEFKADISQLVGLEDKLRRAVANNSVDTKRIAKGINAGNILRAYGATTAVKVLMSYTPVGDNFSNWGYWNYGTYVVYGGDHAEGTLRRGWIANNAMKAEYDTTLVETDQTVIHHVYSDLKLRRQGSYTYYIDIPNCAPYAASVEYGHRVVLPHEKTKKTHVGGAWGVGLPQKLHTGTYRWVPGRYFVRQAITSAEWKSVPEAMQRAYVMKLRAVFSS